MLGLNLIQRLKSDSSPLSQRHVSVTSVTGGDKSRAADYGIPSSQPVSKSYKEKCFW